MLQTTSKLICLTCQHIIYGPLLKCNANEIENILSFFFVSLKAKYLNAGKWIPNNIHWTFKKIYMLCEKGHFHWDPVQNAQFT